MINLFTYAAVVLVALAFAGFLSFCIGLVLCMIFCRLTKRRSNNVTNITQGVGRKFCLTGVKKYNTIVHHAVDGIIKYYIIKISTFPAHWLRMLFYKHVFMMDISDNVVIYKGCRFRAPYKIHIGANSIIGEDCELDGREGIFIGENVNLSSYVRIWTGQHSVNSPDFSYVGASVHIHDRAWVSSNTIILPGCKVGNGAVIAAGAVLTKDIPDFSIVGGIPAKVIGTRNRDLFYSFTGAHEWFL